MTCVIKFHDGSIVRIAGFINDWSAFVTRRIIESNPLILSITWEND